MGTYLSTPVTEKAQESGSSRSPVPLAWGVVDMQGWRKSMEDSHVACSVGDNAAIFGVFDGHGGPEVARFCALYLVSVLQKQPAFLQLQQQQRDEIAAVVSSNETTNDNTYSSSPNGIPPPKQTPMGRALVQAFHALDRMIDSSARRDELVRLRAIKPPAGTRKDVDYIPPEDETVAKRNELTSVPPFQPVALLDMENVGSSSALKTNDSGDPVINGPVVISDEEFKESPVSDDSDVDSLDVAGKEEAANLDDNISDGDDDDDHVNEAGATIKVGTLFHRLLNMNVATATTPSTHDSSKPAPFQASLEQNGRMICNLPDHPIHAGATAIVAVLMGSTLTVANAGDSRAVLCRGGLALPLSFDHKPLDDGEMTRIAKAGGFVNGFGRVNGNLNLSRSIGDLKYKQVPFLSPDQQMITAEPDIIQMQLEPTDEFIILACDGIWDCLTNEQAVEYVRIRIGTRTPVEIGVEMLDEIISVDPRVTQGIGGDNMTVMIIDLQPHSRTYFKAS